MNKLRLRSRASLVTLYLILSHCSILTPGCPPLGLESLRVSDSQLEASSSQSFGLGAHRGRLNIQVSGPCSARSEGGVGSTALGPSPCLPPPPLLVFVAYLGLITVTLCPQSGLEDGDLYDGAWCAEQQDTEPWLQVDAKNPVRFAGIVTQGRNSVWR
jgi:carboxypeptidase X1